MKYRVRNIKTWELYDKDIFLGRDGNFYNRVLECIGGSDKYLVEHCLFTDKNQKEVYVNDKVILGENDFEYRVKLSPSLGIVLVSETGTEYPLKSTSGTDLVLKEE